jgi:hypothetical protein
MQTNKLYQQALSMLESLPIVGLENSEEQCLLNQTILPCKGYCRLCLTNSKDKTLFAEQNLG